MSGIVFGAIAPHGHLAIPEACSPEERGLGVKTQEAMQELERRFAAARPDVVIVCTSGRLRQRFEITGLARAIDVRDRLTS